MGKTFTHNGSTYSEYTNPPDLEDRTVSLIRKFYLGFLSGDSNRSQDYSLDYSLLKEVCIRVDRRKLHYRIFHGFDPVELKEAVSYCYWLVRYKPIVRIGGMVSTPYVKHLVLYKHEDDDVNLKFGLYLLFLAITQYRRHRGQPGVNHVHRRTPGKHTQTSIQDDVEYFLLNRPITEEGLLVFAEGLAKS